MVTDYDGISRVVKVTYPQANPAEPEVSVTTSYNDPYEVTTLHSSGRKKTTVKNGRGQVLYVTDSGIGDDNKTVTAKMGFAYTLNGKRIKRMDLNGVVMSTTTPSAPPAPGGGVRDLSGNNVSYWWYDGFGQLIANSDPDRGVSAQIYDAFGKVVSSTDALGRTTTMAYDRLGRVIQKTLPGAEGIVTFTYDNRAGSSNGIGRLVYMSDPTITKALSYDRLGRTKREWRTFKNLPSYLGTFNKTYYTDFEHDLFSRKTEITYPADVNTGERLSARYTYSIQGTTSLVINYGQGNQTVVSSIKYNEFGQRTSLTRGNGVVTYYTYDNRNRLTDLATTTKLWRLNKPHSRLALQLQYCRQYNRY